jgi:hypothetical protein
MTPAHAPNSSMGELACGDEPDGDAVVGEAQDEEREAGR